MYYKNTLSVVAAEDIVVGDWIVFDPIFGMEFVEEIELDDSIHHAHVIRFKVSFQDPSKDARYIFRGWHEPCPKVITQTVDEADIDIDHNALIGERILICPDSRCSKVIYDAGPGHAFCSGTSSREHLEVEMVAYLQEARDAQQ